MSTDKPYAADMPPPTPNSPQHTGRLGLTVVMLCAVLAVGWFAMHERSRDHAPQTAATRAVSLCEQTVRLKASHPASVDFSEFGRQPPTKMQGGGYQVRLAFTEKDALGDEMAKMAICTVKNGKLQSFHEPKP